METIGQSIRFGKDLCGIVVADSFVSVDVSYARIVMSASPQRSGSSIPRFIKLETTQHVNASIRDSTIRNYESEMGRLPAFTKYFYRL